MTGLALLKDSPIRKEERAIGAWLKTISFSKDFDVGSRRDNADGYRFKTMWYHGAGKYGQADNIPFLLPVASQEYWMTGHVPFIYRRSDISAPPRKGVFTDAGERSKDDAPSARPLRFLDHGGELHDKLVRGYSTAALAAFGASKPVQQTSVRLPDGHPCKRHRAFSFHSNRTH